MYPKRKLAVHAQCPPARLMARFKTNVLLKNKAARLPIVMSRAMLFWYRQRIAAIHHNGLPDDHGCSG